MTKRKEKYGIKLKWYLWHGLKLEIAKKLPNYRQQKKGKYTRYAQTSSVMKYFRVQINYSKKHREYIFFKFFFSYMNVLFGWYLWIYNRLENCGRSYVSILASFVHSSVPSYTQGKSSKLRTRKPRNQTKSNLSNTWSTNQTWYVQSEFPLISLFIIHCTFFFIVKVGTQ